MSRFGSLAGPPASFVIAGARLIDPSAGTDAVGDLAVVDGMLADVIAAPSGARRLDGSGLVVAPGLCDLHAHLREPGGEDAETIASGTRAAAHGGYTTVCAMPNTDPPLDEPARVAWVQQCAADASCDVRVVAAATRGRAGEQPTDAAALAELGAVAFSDDGAAISTSRMARAVLGYLAPLGVPLLEHAEDPSLAAGALIRSGPVATRLGLAAWPASAELVIVERDIALAREVGARVHLTHLSTAASLDAVRRAKAEGLPVTCDVTPHHFALTDAWVAGERRFAWHQPDVLGIDPFGGALDPARAYDALCRVSPPLPAREDALALLNGLADGTVDAIATDHAPHPPERKAVEFGAAAPGIIGLETALSLGLAAVEAGCIGLMEVLAAMSSRPGALIGDARSLAPGTAADLVVFDPEATWRADATTLASASTNTPLLGMDLPGVVRLTVANGRITYDDLIAA
jgi:dihydroorotase